MGNKGSVPSKSDVLNMFDDADLIGLDDESSSIIVANLNATTLPMCVGSPIDEIETDDVMILFFIIDSSPSMEPVEQDLIEGFNEIIIEEGLRKGAGSVVSTIEVGGISFNERIRPLWGGGFTKLADLPKLTKKDYNTRLGGATALNQAALDGFTAVTARTLEITKGIGVTPKTMIVILSDGANNCHPYNAAEVKKVADGLSNEIFVKVFVGFETDESVDFKSIAADMGFPSVFEIKRKPGDSKSDLGRSFRHTLGVVSSAIIRHSKSQITPDSSANFWQASI